MSLVTSSESYFVASLIGLGLALDTLDLLD